MKEITAFQYVKPRDINPETLVYVYNEYDDNNKLIRVGIRRSVKLDDIEDAETLEKINSIKDFILNKEG